MTASRSAAWGTSVGMAGGSLSEGLNTRQTGAGHLDPDDGRRRPRDVELGRRRLRRAGAAAGGARLSRSIWAVGWRA
jgi:hypothetical protein